MKTYPNVDYLLFVETARNFEAEILADLRAGRNVRVIFREPVRIGPMMCCPELATLKMTVSTAKYSRRISSTRRPCAVGLRAETQEEVMENYPIETACPNCHQPVKSYTNMTGPNMAQPGDPMICGKCFCIHTIAENGQFTGFTSEQLADLQAWFDAHPEQLARLLDVVKKIQYFRASQN